MNSTQLAFVNQQLADMLRCGIPLEGSLRQICAGMRRGKLRQQLELLEADLAVGVPLDKAIAQRKLPEFYTRLIELGARSHDFPGILTMLADYYENAGEAWAQLKGLMVYPVIVLILSLVFSTWAAMLGHQLANLLGRDRQLMTMRFSAAKPPARRAEKPVFFSDPDSFLWIPPIAIGAVGIPVVAVMFVPALRRRMAWRLPAFREANLSRVAKALSVSMRAGAAFPLAVSLTAQMERGTRAGVDLARWRQRCADGSGKFAAIAEGSKAFPPMFVWIVAGAGEDMAAGFERAAQVYQSRSAHKTNVLLFAALPVSLLFLGLIILSQIFPIGRIVFDLPRFLFG